MAKFLTTSGISHHLEEIIKNAEEKLVIISPYLKVNRRVRELIEDKNSFRIDIRVIYGKSELKPEEIDWLESMTSIRTSFRENLHAKCYMNEKTALLTSMNLYEFSQQNNDEMGILVSADEDTGLYESIRQEALRIERASQGIRLTAIRFDTSEDDGERPPAIEAADDSQTAGQQPRTSATRRTPRARVPKTETPSVAFCIRCKTKVPVDPSSPYCKPHFKSWNRYKNDDYEENHCHTCGDEHTATMLKPVCLTCYRKYRNVLEFA